MSCRVCCRLASSLLARLSRQVPVLCITGQVPQALIGLNSFQEINMLDIVKPITKARPRLYQITPSPDGYSLVVRDPTIPYTPRHLDSRPRTRSRRPTTSRAPCSRRCTSRDRVGRARCVVVGCVHLEKDPPASSGAIDGCALCSCDGGPLPTRQAIFASRRVASRLVASHLFASLHFASRLFCSLLSQVLVDFPKNLQQAKARAAYETPMPHAYAPETDASVAVAAASAVAAARGFDPQV